MAGNHRHYFFPAAVAALVSVLSSFAEHVRAFSLFVVAFTAELLAYVAPSRPLPQVSHRIGALAEDDRPAFRSFLARLLVRQPSHPTVASVRAYA